MNFMDFDTYTLVWVYGSASRVAGLRVYVVMCVNLKYISLQIMLKQFNTPR
jgi:hypothetical protein